MTTPSGRSSRAASLLGDDYQHLHAWSEVVHALRPGSDAADLRVEAVGAGAYDDVSVLHAAGPNLYVQAKFAVDPTDGFGVDWLTAPTGAAGRPRSLARDALAAYRLLSGPDRPAPRLRLVTNRLLAPGDLWMETFRSPLDDTLGRDARRLADGLVDHPDAAAGLDRLREHLACGPDELAELLDAWQLAWAASRTGETAVVRARMGRIGLREDDQALAAGLALIRSYVTAGDRSVPIDDLRADVDALGLRAAPPARVLSVSALGPEPLRRDADEHVDLTALYSAADADEPRGADPAAWDAVPTELRAAAGRLASAGAGRVLVRAAARLPVWFAAGAALRDVQGFVVATDFKDEIWASDHPRAPGPHLAAEPGTTPRDGSALVVGLSVTADVRPDVSAYLDAPDAPQGAILWLCVPVPGPGAVTGPAAAAAIADDARREISGQLRIGRHRTVHLFVAAPKMIPLFLGHRWHRLPPAVYYEDLGIGQGYQPATRAS